MARQAVSYVFPSVYARPLPSILSQQKSVSQGNIPVGGSSQDSAAGAGDNLRLATIMDTHMLVAPTGLNSVDGTAAVVGKVAHVCAFANQTCEIRLFFGGNEQNTQLLMTTASGPSGGMMQVADYPPLFVPNSTTQWTVYRNIVIHDRYFVPVLVNLSASAVTSWRMHWTITDRVIG